MARTRKLWHLRPTDPPRSQRLATEMNVSPVVAQLLLARGVTDATAGRRFLTSTLADLHPPHLLPGVVVAAERLLDAVARRRPIRVYGDYDADGVTGTAILFALLGKLGGKVDFYIPERQAEGYGLNLAAVRALPDDGVEVLVTVDCGITAVAEAAEAKRLGIDVIVTDHHEPLAELPDAVAVVHPALPGTSYPFRGLSGSGVALKLAWEIARRASGGERASPELREFLLDAVGLAALGLVADLVPLWDENRVLVRHGLDRLVKAPSVGVKALIDAAGMAGKPISSEDIAFKLAPRLNAAGRLGCARLVVDLLTTRSPAKAKEIAEYLNKLNTDRQTIERQIAAQAREMAEATGIATAPAVVLASAEWHSGVIGIVAGRLVEQFGRPVVLIALKGNDEPSTGSGRSVPGFALHEALRACTGELVGHGGHAMAAGVRVRPSRIEAFRERFVAYAAAHFPGGPPAPRLTLDAEVPLSAVTFGLLKDIGKLEPYGADNPRPKFLAAGLTIDGTPRRMGTDQRHLSFRVRQGGTALRAVAWGMGDRLDELMSAGGACCLAFSPKVNEWNGNRTVEMDITDLTPGAEPELG